MTNKCRAIPIINELKQEVKYNSKWVVKLICCISKSKLRGELKKDEFIWTYVCPLKIFYFLTNLKWARFFSFMTFKNKKRAVIEIAARINPISYEKPSLKR
jgi:hypothetical protein